MMYHALIFLLFAAACHAAIDENLPAAKLEPKEVRAAINKLIKGTDKVNLAVIQDCIDKSISVGATIYNEGDIKGCYTFYRETSAALVKTFSAKDSATPRGARAIATLKAALASAAKYGNADRQAWAMRYGFDKIVREAAILESNAKNCVETGTQFFGMGNYREAEDAFRTVMGIVADLRGPDVSALSLDILIGVAALSHSLYAQEKWTESSKALQDALELMPEWPTYPIDQRVFYRDRAEHEKILKKLEAAAKAKPNDTDLHFLLGHERFFSGQKENAFNSFRSVLKQNPKHAGALLFRRLDPQSELQAKIKEWISKLAAGESKERDAAEKALKGQGVWAAPALRKAFETTDDPEVVTRIRKLLQTLTP